MNKTTYESIQHSRSCCSASLLSVMDADLRATSVGFDLAADFLCSIVFAVDLMTIQTRDIRNTSEKLAGVPLGDAKGCRVPSSFCAGIDKHLFFLGRLSSNSLKSTKLGV